jgi:hypothetical protein
MSGEEGTSRGRKKIKGRKGRNRREETNKEGKRGKGINMKEEKE